jgi:hypothetical protein
MAKWMSSKEKKKDVGRGVCFNAIKLGGIKGRKKISSGKIN